jgi:serine/threonine-protein kinase
MGAVYLAHDAVLKEDIALKVVASHLSADADAAERLKREASAARKVSSPHVIRIHDLGQSKDGLLYISMEYFPADTLGDVLSQRGTLSLADHRDILGPVCTGLEAAHAAGVTHRDLKPANVLVGPRGAVKLIDFGLASATFLSGMTATGLAFGTPEYMSPEQVRGKAVDARSDVYSLGAVAYHALTGRPPFSGDTPIAIGFAHCTRDVRPPRELREELPEKLDAAIVAALAKRPEDRPSLADFKASL